MHSIYNVKKERSDAEAALKIRSRSENRAPAQHQIKTQVFANRYEVRVDSWLRDCSESPPPRNISPTSVFHHRFRDRSPDKEIAHGHVSPFRYLPEATRIAQAVEIINSGPTDTWSPRPITIFRARDKTREIHPNSTFRYRARGDSERIQEYVQQNLVPERSPWTRFDHSLHSETRSISPEKWVAGEGNDFDLGIHLSDGFPHNFLAVDEPYAPQFGSKPDDFRKRDHESEIAGEFQNFVPGYFPDSTPGKWEMSRELPRASEVLAASATKRGKSSSLGSPISPTSREHLGDMFEGGFGSVASLSSTSKRIRGGRLVSPKSYWKAGSQISSPAPSSVDRYNSNSERHFGNHHERSQIATTLLLDHKNLTSTSTSATRIASKAQSRHQQHAGPSDAPASTTPAPVAVAAH